MLQHSMKIIEFTQEYSTDLYDLQIQQVGYQACERSHHYGPAVRQHYLIHFVKHGKGIYEYNDSKVEVCQNEFFLIPPNEVTFYKADEFYPWEYYWFGFSGDCCEELIKSLGFTNENRVIKYNLTTSYLISRVVKDITDRKILNMSDKIYELAKLYEIFSWMRKSYEIKTQSMRNISPEIYLLNAAEEYMKRSYMLNISVKDVASHIGVDRTQVYRYFKNAYDKSPKEYLIELRMSQAEKLIRETQLSIKQISYSVGYHDQYLFSKMFKKNYGLSPKYFRESLNRLTI